MKKLITLMVCVGIASPLFAAAPTTVDLAKKAKSLSEARNYIQQALADPQLNNQAETYYVAGKIEMDAYDDGYKTKMINPNDPSVQGNALADEIMAAYNYFVKALPLDSVPNEKGQIKPKYSKDIVNRLSGHINDIFSAGADYYNSQAYYPQAYEAFLVFGDLPNGLLASNVKNLAPGVVDQIPTAYFNAALAANQGGNMEKSAEAFKKARLSGYDKPEATIYEIACWQSIAQNDENRVTEAQNNIRAAAQFGIDKFGLQEPIFINNLINSMVTNKEIDQSLATLDQLIESNPDMANLYGLRGYVYDVAGNEEMSEKDYRKASSLPSVDFETLKNTATQLYRIGASKLDSLEGNSPEVQNARMDLKNNYFLVAQDLANKANDMKAGDPVIQSLLDRLDYALTTFF